MDHLVHIEEKEITINFELGRKCKTVLHFRSLMHTMLVAFKLQTTSPYKFSVRPSNGYVLPLAEFTIEIILKPQQELPPTFPFSDEKFVLKTALAPFSNDNSVLPERVCKEWFSCPTTHVYIDAKLKVVYIGAHLLRQCVASKDVFAVEQMLMRQTGVSVAAEDGRTALHLAASTGSSKLVDMLLQRGAEIDATDVIGRTPLWEAISGGHMDLVKELLARGAHTDVSAPNNSTAAIHVAATLASPKVLEVLIENGASLETKDQEGRTALHFAAEAERIESLKVLLQAGADINAQRADGRTPLLIAAENGSLEMVNLLLESGANTNIKTENGRAASEVASEKGHVVIVEALKAGEALLQAARQGDAKAVATLLQHGGGKKAWAQDSAGWTALHVAAFKGHMQIVRRLLLAEGGTKALHETDAEGHTPLHCAAEGGSREVVELLLAMGANPLAASSRGATPAKLASALGFSQIARLLQQRACHPAIDCLSQGQPELDAKDLDRMCSSITKSCLLRRWSVSPGPDLSSVRMRSATPSPYHKEALTASSIRFSTPKRLPQSEQQLHKEPCSTSLSLLTHAAEVPKYTKLGSFMDKKNLAPSQPQASATDMFKSSDVKSMLHPDEQKVLKNAAQSKHPFLRPMPLSASLKRTTALEPLKATKVEETAPATHVQHAVPGQIVDHRRDINSLSQPLQKSFLPQSHHIQKQSEKEDYNAATSMPQHITLKNSSKLHGGSHKHHPKQTLAVLLDRVHGSKMEVESSSSRKSIQRKMSSNLRDKSTTKKATIPTADMVSQDRTFLQNQLQDGHNLVSDNKHYMRQDASIFQKDKSTMTEVAIPTLDTLSQDRAFIQNRVKDSQNLADGNQQCPRPDAPLFRRHTSPAKKVAIPASDMLLQDGAFVQNQEKERNQQRPRQDASLYQRSKSTTKETRTPTSDMLSQDTAFVQNKVKDDSNLHNGNHNSVRRNATSLFQRSKSTTKEVAIPTSDKDNAPIQNMTHGRVVHGHRHPAAASSLSKKTQRTCEEAQTRLHKSNIRQQFTNDADLEECPKDPPKLKDSLPKNEDRAQQNSGILSATQPQFLMVDRSTNMKGEEPSKPLFKMKPQFLTGNAIVGIEGPPLDNHVSAVQPQFKYEGIRGPGFKKENNISSALPCHKMDDITIVEDTKFSTSSRSLVSQSDLAHILTTPNPADSVLLSRPHMEQACPSMSTSSSVQTSPDKLLQSEHNNHVQSHFASSDASERGPTPPKQEMMRDIDTQIILPHQSTSLPCKTDQMQLEETQSLKPTCKASWNDQNRPIYTPPLRIKQMRKPMSTPILRNSNSPRQMRTEEVPTKATGTSEEKPAKARSVTFRALFSQGTF